MARRSVEITGLDDILRALNQVQNKTEIKKEILEKGARYLEDKIRRKAGSIDDGVHSPNNAQYGTIESNIKIYWDNQKEAYYVSTGKAFWSVYLEYGTKKMNAKPFFEPTFRQYEAQMVRIISEEAKRRLGL